MASEEQLSDNEDASFNSFNNDGSFMEKFRRMQEQQKLKKAATQNSKNVTGLESRKMPATTGSFMPATLTSKRVTKGGAVIMKLSGVKKKSGQAVKLKPAAGLVGDSSSEDEGETRKKEYKKSVSSSPSVAPPTVPPITPAVGSSFGAQTVGMSASALSSSSATRVSSGFTGVGGASSSIVGGDSTSSPSQGPQQVAGKKRKRASRWSDAQPSTEVTASTSKVAKQSADDIAIAAAMASFDALPVQSQQKCHMTEKQLEQIREQIEMNRMVAEIQKAMKESEKKRNKLDYDSDEDTEGGTWEHKARMKEMAKTRERAQELTDMNKGKHHISDFLPPEELAKFIERVDAIKEGRDPDFSDYKEHKITEENVGFKLLQKAGWTEGAGLGAKEDGIIAPINKGKRSFDQSGVGSEVPAEVKKEDDEFALYRKRMMLAYRFRPNPLNNPRRPYY